MATRKVAPGAISAAVQTLVGKMPDGTETPVNPWVVNGIDLAPVIDPMKVAVATEVEASGKWVKVGDKLYLQGVRIHMIAKKGGDPEMIDRVKRIVRLGFTQRIQDLLAVPKSLVPDLSEAERAERVYWRDDRTNAMLKRVREYVARAEREGVDRGPGERKNLEEQIQAWVKEHKDKVRKADADKLTFDVPEMLDWLDNCPV